jgi:hypothetical protein
VAKARRLSSKKIFEIFCQISLRVLLKFVLFCPGVNAVSKKLHNIDLRTLQGRRLRQSTSLFNTGKESMGKTSLIKTIIVTRDHIHNTILSLKLKNWHNTLECYITQGLKGLPGISTQAYLIH